MSAPTHLIQSFPSEDRAVLSRKSDGMILAMRHGSVVGFGENPEHLDRRVFIGPGPAMSFLRKLADVDNASQIEFKKTHPEWNPQTHAMIEEVDAEPRIVNPDRIVKRRPS